MKLYMLTDESRYTHGNTNKWWGADRLTSRYYSFADDKHTQTKWGDGVTHQAGRGKHWIHAYKSPELAALMNPIHADFYKPRLWEAEGEVGIDDYTRVGVKKLTTTKEIPCPRPTKKQRIKFGILVAKAVSHLWRDASQFSIWEKWADGWLANPPPLPTAYFNAAARAVGDVVDYAVAAAARAADADPYAAALAADAAARAADAADADAYVVDADVRVAAGAAYDASRAANAAAYAVSNVEIDVYLYGADDTSRAAYAAAAEPQLDLCKIALEAMKEEVEARIQ